jgi:hypothetical protein
MRTPVLATLLLLAAGPLAGGAEACTAVTLPGPAYPDFDTLVRVRFEGWGAGPFPMERFTVLDAVTGPLRPGAAFETRGSSLGRCGGSGAGPTRAVPGDVLWFSGRHDPKGPNAFPTHDTSPLPFQGDMMPWPYGRVLVPEMAAGIPFAALAGWLSARRRRTRP